MAHVKDDYSCPVCRRRFYSFFDLDEHMTDSIHHACETCHQTFILASYLDTHSCDGKISPLPLKQVHANSPSTHINRIKETTRDQRLRFLIGDNPPQHDRRNLIRKVTSLLI